jgi:N-acetylglutamate synthase-like GNAT family acetyltransferase
MATVITIRKAKAKDARAIRELIWRVGINPLGLNWRRFLVAETEDGRIAGCGQIKPHMGGPRELASIAVQPEFQGQGIGRQIIEHLLAENLLPLYLTCQQQMGPYYEKFGFQVIAPQEMPAYFRRVWKLYCLLRRLSPNMRVLLVMRKG